MEYNNDLILIKSFIHATDKILEEVKYGLSTIDKVTEHIEKDFKRESLKQYYAEFSKEMQQLMVVRYEISKIAYNINKLKEEMIIQFFIEKNASDVKKNLELIPDEAKKIMDFILEIRTILGNLEIKFELCRQKYLADTNKENTINFEYIQLDDKK